MRERESPDLKRAHFRGAILRAEGDVKEKSFKINAKWRAMRDSDENYVYSIALYVPPK